MTITIRPKNKEESEKIKTILKAIEVDFVEDSTKDWWDETSEAEKQSIEMGLKDSRDGKIKPHSEAKKLYEKYL